MFCSLALRMALGQTLHIKWTFAIAFLARMFSRVYASAAGYFACTHGYGTDLRTIFLQIRTKWHRMECVVVKKCHYMWYMVPVIPHHQHDYSKASDFILHVFRLFASRLSNILFCVVCITQGGFFVCRRSRYPTEKVKIESN